ncbi:MAG: DUF4398 domain-containing protein [Myxococcales bacterium]|nr:DUF4398 domain-containing protein [Myxococcales bacterium]
MKTSPGRSSALAVFALVASLGGIALASRAGGDREQALAALGTLEGNPAHARLAHEPITSAKRALTRADEARASGDMKHAPELEALAREHAETASDLVRAAEAEKKRGDAQKQLSDAETQLSRAKALLEETLARRGRAQAKLEGLEVGRATPDAGVGPNAGKPSVSKPTGKPPLVTPAKKPAPLPKPAPGKGGQP